MSDDPFALTEQPTGPVKGDEGDYPPGFFDALDRGPISPQVPAVPSPVSDREVAKVSKWSGRVALGGLALAGAAAGIYYSSRPPRRRKKRTEGQKVGIIGMGIGAAAAVLAGAAFATSKMIAKRIKPKSKHPWRR